MRFLLDTHIFLWMISSPQKLKQKVKLILENGDNLLFLSAMSGLEISIKYQIGKLKLPEQPVDYIIKKMNEYAIEELSIKMVHAAYVNTLPEIHKDPFDRLLIAQSIIEKLPLITNDKIIKKYSDIELIW